MRFPLVGPRIELRPFALSDGSEAATLCLEAAFTALGAREVIALVQPANERSVALVTKLGFTPDGEAVAHGAPHTLYRLTRNAFDHA